MTIELTASEEFHGLRSRAFSLTPDLRFAYHSRSHTRALEEIARALKRREGIVVVTGEVGTGKTMLCRALLETFETRTFQSVILDPLLTVEDLLHQVLTDFGLMSARDSAAPRAGLTEVARHDLVSTLQKFLSSLIPLNAHAVIIIDEAQHLTGPVLEQVRLLSNFETDEAKLLQIVLVGQPNLDILLQRPDMQQLNQRVARRCQLEPLSETEVRDYIEHRLAVASEDSAGGKTANTRGDRSRTVQFTSSALQLVATASRGIPRLVNTISDRALDAAFEQREHVVDRRQVLIAAERLRLPLPAASRHSRTTRTVAAAIAVAIVALAAGWWWSHRGQPATAPPAVAVPTAPVAAPTPSDTSPTATSTTPAAPAPVTAAGPSGGAAGSQSAVDSAAAAAPAAGTYSITAASFKTEERAAAVTQDLAGRGMPVRSRIDATGGWYRVIVGPFATQEDARAAQEKLGDLGFEGTRIALNGPPAP